MKADYLSYRRAATVSLLGLGLQVAMGVTLLIYAAVMNDHAAMSGSLLILAGTLVWLMLAIVYDQHRRERVEAMEVEALNQSGARESSAFSEGADDFRVAAKRLAWMHRVLVPLSSVLFIGLLVGIGVWRYRAGEPLVNIDSYRPHESFGWPVSLGLGLAVTGFIFARFVSGMAKQKAWANLRAGAAMAVLAALVGLAVAVGWFVDYAGPNTMARYLQIAMPIAMFVLAGEVVLNLLLAAYRPRAAGEIPKPAFDSRILGFVAAPDRIAESIGGAINYQFGFDVTGSWFYQLLTRRIGLLLLAGGMITWLMTCVGIVQPNEQGLRVRMGRLVSETPLKAGFYFKLPWPLERVDRFDATTVRRINLAGEPPKLTGSILWTNDHGVAEQFFPVQPSELERRESAAEGIVGAVSDFSLVNAEVPMLYVVDDYAKFERAGDDAQREEILRATGRREVAKFLATQSVDAILGRGRPEISKALRERVEAAVAKLDMGVRVLFTGIEGVHPPRETAAMFEAVIQALPRREGALEQANTIANSSLIKVAGTAEKARAIVAKMEEQDRLVSAFKAIASPTPEQAAAHTKAVADKDAEIGALIAQAGGSAAATIQKAKSERWVRHMAERGRLERFSGQLAAYRAAPSVYTSRLYFDTLRDAMANSRLFVVAPDVEVRLDLNQAQTGGNIFNVRDPNKPSN